MPLDPQAKAVIDQFTAAGKPDFATMTPPQARQVMSEMFKSPVPPLEVGKVVNRTVQGPAGEIPVRVYTPKGNGPFPVLAFYHGGGWVIGDLESHDPVCRALTNAANVVTVSIDYRLAPEHKFPAAPEDCYAATKWIADNAAALGADGKRLAVGGDSAGGNLAAVVSLMARDRGTPKIDFQLLVYPATDRAETKSHVSFAEGYFLTRASMHWFWNHYLKDERDKTNPYASPLRARDLGGLPPALVITAEFDPLRDEGQAYAAKLKEAGVPVTYTQYDGMIHGFFSMGDVLDKGKKALAQAAEALKTALK
jgi:acetyl esterase